MYIFREFDHQFIEISYFKISNQQIKLWNLKNQFWDPLWNEIFKCRLLENLNTKS